MILDVTTAVTRNLDLGHGDHVIEFELPGDMIGDMRPAQFFMIGIPGSEILLRRPFSVCGLPGTFDDSPPGRARVLYRVIGRATRMLAALKPGATLTVLGPLGNGFDLPDDREVRPVLVAGGIGSAPFPALVAEIERTRRPAPVLCYGARSADELPLLGWFRERCGEVRVSTDDGSLGIQGQVTGPLRTWLDDHPREPAELFVCGPGPMLKAVSGLARERGIRCQLSLEAHMACGFGVCIGCVVPVRGDDGSLNYERVCVEGPVMPAERMAW